MLWLGKRNTRKTSSHIIGSGYVARTRHSRARVWYLVVRCCDSDNAVRRTKFVHRRAILMPQFNATYRQCDSIGGGGGVEFLLFSRFGKKRSDGSSARIYSRSFPFVRYTCIPEGGYIYIGRMSAIHHCSSKKKYSMYVVFIGCFVRRFGQV